MPSIPRASDLNRAQVTGQTRVSTASTAAVGTGVDKLASVLGQIGDSNQQRKTNYEISQARTEFLKAKAREDNAYSDDEEYETMGERYSNNMNTELENAAGFITNVRARREFMNESSVQLAQGHERIKLHAKRVETDYQRGYILEAMDGIRNAALTGDTMATMFAADGLVDSAIDMDYMSAEEGADIKMKWRNDVAVSKLEMMAPEDRIEALKEDWAQNIHADIRHKITEEAKVEEVDDSARENVASYADMSDSEAYAAIDGIENTDEYDETLRRFENQKAREGRQDARRQDELHRAYFNEVRLSGMSIDDIPPEELDAMDPAIVKSLKTAEANWAAGLDPTTPRLVVDTLNSLYRGGSGEPMRVRAYFQDVAHLMSRADYESWSKTTTDSFEDMESDPIFTGTQMITDKLREVTGTDDINDSSLSKYRQDLQQYVFDYRRDNEGKDPSGQEQSDFINKSMLVIPTDMTSRMAPGLPRPTDYNLWDEMGQEEQRDAIFFLRTLDGEAWQEAARRAGGGDSQEGLNKPKEMAYWFSLLSESDDR